MTGEQTVLYGSGTSCHVSPFYNQFPSYIPIIPKPTTPANNHTFKAIRRGNIMITLLNGNSSSCILLCDILHVPGMGTTLISISRLDTTGYATLFRDGPCQILDGKKKS